MAEIGTAIGAVAHAQLLALRALHSAVSALERLTPPVSATAAPEFTHEIAEAKRYIDEALSALEGMVK
jgi:hypothetical protein